MSPSSPCGARAPCQDAELEFTERRGNVWALSLEDGEEYPITDLVGRPGNKGRWGLATDGDYVYFLWTQAVGDIWVMDVVQE